LFTKIKKRNRAYFDHFGRERLRLRHDFIKKLHVSYADCVNPRLAATHLAISNSHERKKCNDPAKLGLKPYRRSRQENFAHGIGTATEVLFDFIAVGVRFPWEKILLCLLFSVLKISGIF
jgi:hypothetical protein